MWKNKIPIDDVKILPALDKPSNLPAAKKNLIATVNRLEQFIMNDHSCEGLSFQYKSVKTFC